MVTKLTVFEGDRLDIGSGSGELLAKNRLLAVVVGKKQAFELRRGTLYATDLVGAVQVGDLKVEVLPKPFGISSKGDARLLLFDLLRWAGDAITPNWLPGGATAREADLLEVVERRVAAELLRHLEVGVPRRYQEVHEKTSVIRGRIDFAQYARQLPSAAHIVPVRHFPLAPDNVLNRLLKALATTLRNRAGSYTTRRDLDLCLDMLAPVRTVTLTSELVQRVRLSRMEADWLGLVELAGLLAAGNSPDPTSVGVTSQATLMFPMNRLFESAVRRTLAAELTAPFSCLRSSGDHRLLSTAAAPASTPALAVRPDLIFNHDRDVAAPGDAKWKRLRDIPPRFGILPTDVFQLLTYMRLFNSSTGLLFFPRADWMPPDWLVEFVVSPARRERIVVLSVNLSQMVSANSALRRRETVRLVTQVEAALLGARHAAETLMSGAGEQLG